MQFYDAQTSGNPLGSQIDTTVTLSPEGLFNLSITPPTAIFSASQVWYEIGIDSDDPVDNDASDDVFPDRVQVFKVPFAIQAEEVLQVDADRVGAGNVDNTEFDALNGVTSNVQSQIDNFSAYDDLTAESKIGAGAAQVAAGDHSHAFDDLTGSLSNDDFSAIGDLGAEGKLENNAGDDILTRDQADARYIAGSVTFDLIGGGTNNSAAMVIDTGGSLTTSGSGSITASAVKNGALGPLAFNGIAGNGSSGQLIQTDGDGTFSYTSVSTPTKLLKAADTTYNGTTAANDPHLQFAVDANSVYHVTGVLVAQEDEAGDGDVVVSLSGPAGTLFRTSLQDPFTTSTYSFKDSQDAFLDGTPRPGEIRFAVLTSGTSGTVNLRFSQYVDTGQLRVKAGSFLLVTKGN